MRPLSLLLAGLFLLSASALSESRRPARSDLSTADLGSRCENGNEWRACREASQRLRYGEGTARDFDEARRYLVLAGKLGNLSTKSDLLDLELDRRCALIRKPARGQDQSARRAGHGQDCGAIYYEATGARDFAKARECARSGPGDPLILAMLFANGQGGERDLEQAFAAACEAGLAAGERSSLLSAIASIEEGRASGPLDVCEHVSGGTAASRCAKYSDLAARARDDDAMEEATQTWRAETREAWRALLPRMERFLDIQSEILNLERTGEESFSSEVIATRARLRHALIDRLIPLAKHAPEPGDEAALEEADKELFYTFTRVRAKLDPGRRKLLDNSEIAWRSYREALARLYAAEHGTRFGKMSVKQDTLTRLARERRELLLRIEPRDGATEPF